MTVACCKVCRQPSEPERANGTGPHVIRHYPDCVFRAGRGEVARRLRNIIERGGFDGAPAFEGLLDRAAELLADQS